jgi:hypothetical protein
MAGPAELAALAAAALILILTLVVSFRCVQLFGLRRPRPRREGAAPPPARRPKTGEE